ncbi:MAG: hypothetical protein ACREX3_18960, partial [Gammaproteobacteria bacterium]
IWRLCEMGKDGFPVLVNAPLFWVCPRRQGDSSRSFFAIRLPGGGAIQRATVLQNACGAKEDTCFFLKSWLWRPANDERGVY